MISTIANRTSKTLLRTGISRAAIISSSTSQATATTRRDISIGTDLSVSECTLQKARPWVRTVNLKSATYDGLNRINRSSFGQSKDEGFLIVCSFYPKYNLMHLYYSTRTTRIPILPKTTPSQCPIYLKARK